ncbi:Chromatin accessibility complex protein [Ooceraea biroi]|nr:Chromatin accessibility complex protein [Ooceraea biroi]
MKELRLPISRVKTIMKSSPSVDTVGQDGLYLVTKATEHFIHYLTEEAHTRSNKGSSLDYKHLAEVVQTNDTLEFLREIMPRKITVRQFKEMMAAKNASHSSSSDSSSDSDSDSDSDTGSCSDSDETKAENGNSESGSDEQESDAAKENGACHSASDKSESSVKSDSDDDNKR